MPILIRNNSQSHLVAPGEFAAERNLEDVLADHPGLLTQDEGRAVKFVDRQVLLPNAGRLDLLFVDREGLPIIVEAKLARNEESRRDVVAQAIDYLSALTALTVDELDTLVNGKLELALR